MAAFTLQVNGRTITVDVDPSMPLLWVLRDRLQLTGTKYGCGIGSCGACTVLQGDRAVRSCTLTIAAAATRSFTTIEGLSETGDDPCQRAWIDEDVAQCGYCQPGMILEAVALLRAGAPTDAAIDTAIGRHICRCGTYARIRAAIRRTGARA